jgi:hypothetical protein
MRDSPKSSLNSILFSFNLGVTIDDKDQNILPDIFQIALRFVNWFGARNVIHSPTILHPLYTVRAKPHIKYK